VIVSLFLELGFVGRVPDERSGPPVTGNEIEVRLQQKRQALGLSSQSLSVIVGTEAWMWSPRSKPRRKRPGGGSFYGPASLVDRGGNLKSISHVAGRKVEKGRNSQRDVSRREEHSGYMRFLQQIDQKTFEETAD
jgi:hypothetical protein